MCLNCETDEELADCAFDADEHHPDDWSGEFELDNNDREYNPYQGSVTPTEGRCNAPLDNWDERYGETRYCMRLPMSTFVSDGSDFCKVHKGREGLMERAADAFTHGLFSKTIRHTFEKLQPWQQLTALGWYDAYLQESQFDFDPEFETHDIDFTEHDGELPIEIDASLDEDGCLSVDVPVPTQHHNRCYALYRAAIMDVKSGLAERTILEGDDGIMERETVVSVTDDGREITDLEEHHLNVPLSRLDNDRSELLAFGGVTIKADEDDVSVNVESPGELVLDLDEGDTVDEDEATPVEAQMIDEGSTEDDE